jgi:alpha 1,3-glucosidase
VTVKRENFKTCDQSGFCNRNRAYADSITSSGSSWTSPYQLDAKSITFVNGQLQGVILKNLGSGDGYVRLPLTITFLQSGTARVTIDEEKRQKGDIELRHNSVARKERYNEAQNWAIVGGLDTSKAAKLESRTGEGLTTVLYGPSHNFEAVVRHSPFGIEFKRDGQIHVRFNERGFLNVEHWRPKVEREQKEGNEGEEASNYVSENEGTWWEESFGGNTDTKPKGPESIGLDISFPAYEHVFGIPEHTGPLSLKETRYVLALSADNISVY